MNIATSRSLGAIPYNPTCVWNQAYNENFDADKYSQIMSGARNCYVLVDPFDGEMSRNPSDKIDALHERGNAVGCYISTGSCEAWRDDFDDIKRYCVDKQWGEWAGEYFVFDTEGIFPYMKARIDKMSSWGCDYVEFDNMDWCTDSYYRNTYGSTPGQEFPSTPDCAQHNANLCDYTRQKNMRCMSKNSGYNFEPSDHANGDLMDAVTFESYKNDFNWWDDRHLQGFLDNGKPVIIVHYNAGSNDNRDSCDYILKKYQNLYNSQRISFICESRPERKYIHFNLQGPPTPTVSPPTPPTPNPPPTTPGNVLDMFPFTLNTLDGAQSTDQDISVLQTNELTGENDDWSTYIELGENSGGTTNTYLGEFSFNVPQGTDLASYEGAKLVTNFRGDNDGRWQFEIKSSDGSWFVLGDSSSMSSWIWSTVEYPFSAMEVDFASLGNPIIVRLRTAKSNNDACNVDYLKLSFEGQQSTGPPPTPPTPNPPPPPPSPTPPSPSPPSPTPPSPSPPSPTPPSPTPPGTSLKIFPHRIRTQKGTQSDQDISVLATYEMKEGSPDNWNTYIELGEDTTSSGTNEYKGQLYFHTDADLSLYRTAKLTVNFYGHNDGRWQFQIRIRNSSGKWKWVDLGDSRSMNDWEWSLVDYVIPEVYTENGGLAKLQNGKGTIRVRIQTVMTNDDVCDIDFMQLSFGDEVGAQDA